MLLNLKEIANANTKGIFQQISIFLFELLTELSTKACKAGKFQFT